MNRPVSVILFLFMAFFAVTAVADEMIAGPQTPVGCGTTKDNKYPRIVLYSVTWCPHCKEAKEYLTSRNIPFINRDVEEDSDAMKDLTEKYRSTGVPLIVIGNDAKVIKGFNREKFEKILNEMCK